MRQQLIEAALSQVDTFLADNEGVPILSETLFDETITESDKAWIKAALDLAVSSFSKHHPTDFVGFVSTSEKWVTERGAELGIRFLDPKNPCGQETSWDSYCGGKGWGVYILKGHYGQKSDERSASLKSVVAHEFFHSVQDQFDLPKEVDAAINPGTIPVWLIEGSANFFGAAIAHFAALIEYEEQRSAEVDNHPDYVAASLTSGAPSLSAYQNLESQGGLGVMNPYGMGQVAVEYLVANSGVPSLLRVFELTAETRSFSEAFELAIGISLVDFYAKFDSMRAGVGLPKLSSSE